MKKPIISQAAPCHRADVRRVTAVIVLLLAPLVVAATSIARAETATAVAGAGSRIAATDTVRTSMRAIRDAVTDVHSLVTHRRLGKAAAISFAGKVAGHLSAIRGDGAQSDQLRTALAPLLQQISEGAEAVAGRHPSISPIDGIVAIDEALAAYPKLVEHPDWKPPRDL